MTTKSKKTIAAEAALADLQGKLAEARATLEEAFAHDETGDRIPALTATVSLFERRIAKAAEALKACRVGDCLLAIKAASAEHAEALKVYHQGKGRHFDDMIKAHPGKPSVGRELAKNRKYAPEWLMNLRKARHESHRKLLDRFEDLRSLDPREAARLGWQRLDDAQLPARTDGRIEV